MTVLAQGFSIPEFGFGFAMRSGQYTSQQTGGGVPSWVMRDSSGSPATFQLDVANDRGFYKGSALPSEAALLAAVGGSKVGIARTIGGYVAPNSPNFLTNPNYDNGTTGWTPNATATLAVVAGEGEMTAAGSLAVVSQQVSAGAAKATRLRATCRRGTSGNTIQVGVGSNASFGSGDLSPAIGTVSADYTVYGSGAYFACLRNSSGGGTGTVYVDNWRCEECFPFDGWVHETSTLVIKASTPATISSVQVLLSLDLADITISNTERNRTARIQQAADGTVSLIVTSGATAIYTQSFGVISPSTPMIFALSWAGATMHVSFNGQPIVSKVSGSIVTGAAFMHIGRSPTGETWTGGIDYVSYFPTQQPDDWLVAASAGFASTVLFAEGDSYEAGANGVSLSGDLRTLTGRPVAVSAVGGSTLADVITRLQARPYIKGKSLVIWDGSGNSYGSVATTLAQYDQIIAWHGDTTKIIVVPTVAVGPSADGVVSAYTLDMEAIRDGLISRGLWLAGATYDPTTQINTLTTGTAQDLKDVSARVVAQSQLYDTTPGQVHLSQTAMSKVSPAAVAVITAKAA